MTSINMKIRKFKTVKIARNYLTRFSKTAIKFMKSILNNFNEKQLKIILKGTKMMVKAERLEEKTNVAMGQQ